MYGSVRIRESFLPLISFYFLHIDIYFYINIYLFIHFYLYLSLLSLSLSTIDYYLHNKNIIMRIIMRVSLLWHYLMYARVLISTPISSNNASSPSPHTILRKYILSCFFQLAAMRQTGCLSSGRTKVVCCYGWLYFLRGLRFPRLVLRRISPSRSPMITLNVHSFIHCLMKHFSCNWVNLINSFIPWLILISFDFIIL